ncbi:IS110 family transposase, partial [Bacteroides caecimuris]|nr:IS110 family transposase [Bacteroides caecimuris]
MDKDRIVAGLDVHKDTIYLCVMDNTEAVIFAKVYGTLTPDLELMCSEMVSHGV